jgi:hypothetical protein
VRRFLTFLFAVVLALPLVGAAPSTLLGTPVLVVYPLTISSAGLLDKDAGSRLAVTIATAIATLGGVTVKPAPPGTERKDYLTVARGLGADYYVTGFITPLGDQVSVVEQLVSTQTGIVVFSNTGQIKTYGDASSQGDVLRAALLRHQARNIGAYDAPPPPAVAATPVPQASQAAQANIGKLFGRKKPAAQPAATSKPTSVPIATGIAGPFTPAPQVVAAEVPAAATPQPRPTATPTPVRVVAAAPVRTPTPVPVATPTPVKVAVQAPVVLPGQPVVYAVARVTGSDPERNAYATQLLSRAITASGATAAELPIDFSENGLRGDAQACAGASTIVSGNLTTRSEIALGQTQTTATMELFALDCTTGGRTAYHRTFQADAGGDYHNAIDRAVNSAIGAYLHPPKRR